MLKIKFNKYERVAGVFVLTTFLGMIFVCTGIAIKRGWFSAQVSFECYTKSSEGIHTGTGVFISGIRVGAVDEVELISAEAVRLSFNILEKFHPQIRSDSVVQINRPYIIGEKILELSIGSKHAEKMEAGSQIPIKESFDLMDVLSGKKWGPFLGTIEKISNNLRVLGEAFADPDRTKKFVEMFDRLNPLVGNLNLMSQGIVQVTQVVSRKKYLEGILLNLNQLTGTLNQVIPQILIEAPDFGQQMGQIIKNLNSLTTEMQKITPALTAIAPELPKTSLRAVEALNETVILLKALQRSFLLRGKVEEIRKEESRQPASQ
ncbi:MAG: MlaD family protein [Bdellovibrionales bacterium]|nr:MlaD family protein [Bdellovibrionales bacterium]